MQSFLANIYHGELLSLFVLLLFILAAYGTGSFVNRFGLHVCRRDQLSGIIIDTVLGLNMLALITLIFGVCGWLNPFSVWIILTFPALTGIVFLITTAKTGLIFLRKNIVFCVLLIIIALFTLGSALCFPYVWDELTYHIALPFRWLNAGTLEVFADSPFSGLPALPQLLFRLGCENGGILFPRLLTWAAYLILLTAIYLYFKPSGDRFPVLAMTFMFIANPLVINMMRSTYAETIIMLDLLAALLALRNTGKSWRSIFLCGLFAGGAFGVKLTGLGVAAVIFIFLWHKYRKTFTSKLPVLILFFGLGGIIAALPFYLRPWIMTGNPFYPFLASCFGGTEAELLSSKYHYLAGDAHFGLRTLPGFFTVFLLIAFADKVFDGLILGRVFIYLLLLLLWHVRNLFHEPVNLRRHHIYLPAAILVYYCFWFASSQQTRFLLPLLFLMLLAALREINRYGKKRQGLIIAVLFLVWLSEFFYPPCPGYKIGSHSWLAVRHFELSWRNVKRLPENAEGFLKYAANDPGFIEAMAALAEKTPPGSKVMFLYERRGLYCPRPYVIGTPYWQAGFNTPPPASAGEFHCNLHKNHIQYLLIGGTRKNPDELGGMYLLKKEQIMMQVSTLVKNGKLKIIWGKNDFFLCQVL
ncbi:MAG: hypothetical protein PHV59_01220 [Victivallales bacterium]|nr:hypothetical protein [Victivallales bacterium]